MIEKIKNIKLFLFDLDGTLYLGNNLFEFTKPLLEKIKEKNKKYIFLTNNSSKSTEDYILKLKHLGIKTSKKDFLTSSNALVYYLKKKNINEVLYVCGTASLKEELALEGFEISENIDKCGCIIMGNDTELTFKKLYDVCKALSKREIPYIATNPDYVCPTEFGSVPDCGSVCEMIFRCTSKRPVFIGKPEPLMPLLAAEKAGTDIKETAVIGDRIYTDIESGINAGTLSVLVLSGETDKKLLNESPVKPDMVLKDCGELLEIIK